MKSYLKFLSRNKMYTAIEAVGLAVSLAFVIIIGSYIVQQVSVSRENPERKEIYTFGMPDYYGLTKGFTDVLRDRVPEVEIASAYIKEDFSPAVTFEDGTSRQAVLCGTDKEFFTLFPNYTLLSGSLDALNSTSMCLATESFANAHNLTPGSIIRIDGIDSAITVGGIVKDFRRTLFKPSDIILSLQCPLYRGFAPFDQYGSTVTFAKVRQGTDRQVLYDKVEALCREVYPDFYGSVFFKSLSLVRLDEMLFNDAVSRDSRFSRGDAGLLRLLLLVVSLLLLSAVMNYVNLSLALTGKRAKEMATRQLLGSSRKDIILKYIVESILFSAVCFLLAILLAEAFVPTFNRLINDPDIPVRISFTPAWLGAFLLLILITGLAAGFIPAAIAGHYEPIDVVRGTLRRNQKMILSKVFIVTQNGLAIIMIALSLLMEAQYRGTLNRPMNCDYSDCYSLYVSSQQDKTVLLDRLKRLPCVLDAGYGGGPGVNPGGQGSLTRTGDQIIYRFFRMDTTVFRFLKIEVVKDYGTPQLDCVWFGERAFAATGLSDEDHDIGVLSQRASGARDIAGIIKDIPWDNTNLDEEGYIVISIINPETFPVRYAGILIKTTGNHKEAEDVILATVRDWDPGETLYIQESFYLEDNFRTGLQPTRNNMLLMESFTILALLIALLGLLAMSAYYADTRAKDIAVRKVFGGTAESEAWHSIREYMLLVGIAAVIFVPVAVWLARHYLEQFVWKLDHYAWVFVVAVVMSGTFAFISVLWQTLKAAKTNPATELKKE